MAGFWNYSTLQIHDENGRPRIGAKAYFYAGGTSTPITVYKAFSLGEVNKHPNPVQTNGAGFFPPVYLDEADGFYRVRMTTASGVVLFDIDGLPIIGPTEGGGGGGDNPVDPDAVAKTGDIKQRYGTGLHTGWVRGNGRTIGSATSGASERANGDTQPLFEWLWNEDSTLTIVGGRGASALADWNANKQLTLPDFRGYALIGMDTMGNTAAGRVAAATALGWKGGSEKHVLSVDEMPSHNHGGQTSDAGQHDHSVPGAPNDSGTGAGTNGTPSGSSFRTGMAGIHKHTIPAQGGGAAHNNLQPSLAVTIYIKL